jgi:hypothetical protein
MPPTPISRRRSLQDLLALGIAGAVIIPTANAQTTVAPNKPATPPPELLALPAPWPQARQLGGARLRFFGLSIYDAALWAPPGLAIGSYSNEPFALELRYLRSLSGAAIAQRSLDEMRRGGALAPATETQWLSAMRNAFPDVQSGDRITGVNRPQQGVRFYVNGQLKADVADPAFAERFFGIWLAPWTSEPAMRLALIPGLAP